ncbi:Protein of unknown function [Cotesia congregata]|uniref:Uncharacterized protein n=1 Tax=Cotesia congregata TaxID=51543 RepID=A0A8J2H775_COTCN|nr:Protein of unknown function [Cotesia congregata]
MSVIANKTKKILVLRPGERDWEYRGRPGTQQYSHTSVSPWYTAPAGSSDETSDPSPSISLPTPPPPPKAVVPPPPPPPPRPTRRSVTFAESPSKSPRSPKSPKSPWVFRRRSTIKSLNVAVPWTPATPSHWDNRKAEYVT